VARKVTTVCIPAVRGHRSSVLFDEFSLSGERVLFNPLAGVVVVSDVCCLGLYEQSVAWSLLTQFSHGC
jgi:hypothetical protein